MPQDTIVELDGKKYNWTGTGWLDEAFLEPPRVIVQKLDAQLTARLAKEDYRIIDVDELLARARQARDTNRYQRAERLVRRALALSPDHIGALTILCSVLRAQRRPLDALKETAPYVRTASYPPLLVSRAAAWCDLKRWPKAKREVGRALAMIKDNKKEEAFAVVRRIKAARPDLYE